MGSPSLRTFRNRIDGAEMEAASLREGRFRSAACSGPRGGQALG